MTGWFLAPYKGRLFSPRTRYCAMDDQTKQIQRGGGAWREAEIDGNRAIVRVRAADAVIASLGLLYRPLSETEARAAWTATRSKPAYDLATSRIVFTPTKVPTLGLDTLVRDVSDTAPSTTVTELLLASTAIGFGLGWRLPRGLCAWTAAHGIELDRWASLIAPFFNQRGAFPTITTVIDNFNRANEDPLGNGNWATSTTSEGPPSGEGNRLTRPSTKSTSMAHPISGRDRGV